MSVNVIVDRRCASVIDSGTVYGPPPTRNVGPGGEISTCAEPIPGAVVGVACPAPGVDGGNPAGGGVAIAGGAGGATGGGSTGTAGGTAGDGGGVGAGATSTVPGTGDDPGGADITA